MKIEMVDYTHHALEKLLYTKDTRLQGEQSLLDIIAWPEQKKLEHLAYMKDTIQSSWEFVSYTFKISGVTRAFTHQLVRTRQGSYAQESQRTVDVRNSNVINTCSKENYDIFEDCSIDLMNAYGNMIDDDVPIQDARGILPTNIETSIIAKFDLRTIHNMALLRLCTRTQGEYQRVFKAMADEIVKIHPWASDFIKVHCVWYGTCAFPRYKECPMQRFTLAYDDESRRHMQTMFDKIEHEANPKAKDGRTQ